ncbi:MAG: hypothetical protein HY074_06805 [Deltaproteobacteria bacterium]|nr:hypothetical protein [Deltaproteobacteria bacterium]
MNTNRRNVLKASLGALGALASTSALAKSFDAVCRTTPAQTEGPFYPVKDQDDKDDDLTLVRGRTNRARGQVAYIGGIVSDENCRPVPGALVEIWQACASGRYNHPGDENTAPLDPDFQYWGRALTDGNGEYRFRTIVPGAYPADTDWMRPPHIHYKVHRKGYHELTTQMYFAGSEYNDADKILRAVPANERDSVIVSFAPADFEAGALVGRFNLTIRKV